MLYWALPVLGDGWVASGSCGVASAGGRGMESHLAQDTCVVCFQRCCKLLDMGSRLFSQGRF